MRAKLKIDEMVDSQPRVNLMIGRICVAAVLFSSLSIAQTATTPSTPAPSSIPTVNKRPFVFDVASIKPARPGESWHFGFGPTGYSAGGVTLDMVIYQAYFGFNMGGRDAVSGGPGWVSKDTWDIQTKVAAEDIAQYQSERTRTDVANPIGRQMLQNMLADRCKLIVRRVPAEMPAFALVLAKNGPKLKEAAPDEARPSGSIPAMGGGFIVPYNRGESPHITFYAASMSAFAQHLRGMAGGPVIDRTGLTGRYDFNLTWLSLSPDEHEGAVSVDDPDPLSHWNLGALGLKVERVKIPTEHIVIDHIEKPSEN
jgi:uncharacterized protein (TIGR03435 family)